MYYTKKPRRLWLPLTIATIVLTLGGFLLERWYHHGFNFLNQSQGEIKRIMGIKGTAPEKLPSYQSVTGMLDIQHWVTQHGTGVYFVHVPTLPMVDIQVTFDAGAARNGNKGGLAYLVNLALAEGTPTMTADQVAENFDKVGAQYKADSQRDMALVQLRTLSDPNQLIPAVQTMAAILSQPNFPENGIKRVKQNTINLLKQQDQKPQYVSARAFYSLLYGEHPYSNWVLGDNKAIDTITVADLKAFHQKYYVAQNANVVIVGDVSAQDADAIAQTLTNDLPQGERAPALPEVSSLHSVVTKNIEFPSSQTHILIGGPGLTQGDPDFYALTVGNHILGGGPITRIFDIIRNQNGLAYAAGSYFIPMHQKGPFMISCQTRNSQAEKAKTMLQSLLKDFVTQGPTAEELSQAKLNLLGGYALNFNSNAAICAEVAKLGFYQLPLDFFNQFKANVEKLTPEDLKQAFAKRISPDNVVIVTVGTAQENQMPTNPAPNASGETHLDPTSAGGAQR